MNKYLETAGTVREGRFLIAGGSNSKLKSFSSSYGVSMVALVITIIVIIILVAISFGSSTSTIDNANYAKYVNNVAEVSSAVQVKAQEIKGQEAAKGNNVTDEQVYNYLASNNEYFLTSDDLPSYTVIKDEGQFGMSLPKMQYENEDGMMVDVQYAITSEGDIFTWPPYDHDGQLKINSDDIVSSTSDTNIKVKQVEFNVNLDENKLLTDGTSRANIYTVKFNPNDSSNVAGSMSTQTLEFGKSQRLSSNRYEKIGYIFAGWNTETDGSGTTYSDGEAVKDLTTEVNATVNLYAMWTRCTYTISFNSNDGSGTMTNLSMNYNESKNLPANTFSKSGYKFIGWSTTSNATNASYGDEESVKNLSTTDGSTVVLYAVWKLESSQITFAKNGGTGGTDSITAIFGENMPIITVPTQEGYNFEGYFDSTSGGVQYYSSTGTSLRNWDRDSDTTLYARWSLVEYIITLNKNNGTGGTNSVTVTYGSAMPNITVPIRTGYKFKGYYDGSETCYYTSAGVSAKNWDKYSAATLSAHWEANIYVVTLNANGGTGGSSSGEVAYASSMPAITLPTRTGYTFEGYYDAEENGVQYYSTTGTSAKTWDKTENSTLYAHWKAAKYTVTLNNGDSGSSSVSVTYGSAMPTITLPTRTGYAFAGYYDSQTSGTQYYTAEGASSRNWDKTENTTLYARWIANSSTITFNKNNGTGGTSSTIATYGESMPSATMPTRTGYTFKGYYDTETNGTQYYTATGSSARVWDKLVDTTLYAYWSLDTYTVALSATDATTAGTASVTATYGAAMPTTGVTIPERTGYTFEGYFDAETNGMKYYNADGTSAKAWDKTSDTTLYAHWRANEYTVTLSATDATTAGTASVTVTYLNAMPVITIPERTGYTFIGYYDSATNGTKYYTTTGTSAKAWDKTENTTLYARW